MDIKIIQSTKPHRLRPHQRSGMDFCSYISIHEATRLRQKGASHQHKNHLFQSTKPQGFDIAEIMDLMAAYQFQSTKPQGFDGSQLDFYASVYIFQSTKPQGFDCGSPFPAGFGDNFNPRSRKASTAKTSKKKSHFTKQSIHIL